MIFSRETQPIIQSYFIKPDKHDALLFFRVILRKLFLNLQLTHNSWT